MTIRSTFWVFLGLLAASFLAGNFTRSFVYYRVVYLLLFILLFSLIWGLLSIRGLSVKRSARIHRLPVGAIFEERFEVVNPTRYGRLWIEIEDQSNLPGSRSSKVISAVGGRQSRTYVTRTLLQQRGVFPLGPTRLITGDPFGLFLFKRDFPPLNQLLVLPYIVDLDYFPFLPGLLPGGRALHRRTLEVSPHAAGVREYAPGDPLSRIHWKSTARRDHIMVKEFEQDPQADVWILLDAHRHSHIREKQSKRQQPVEQFWFWTHKSEVYMAADTYEYLVSACASIANYYVRSNRAVGFVSHGHSYVALPVERGERQLAKIIETLALLDADGPLTVLGLVNAQASSIARGSTVVLLTPSRDIQVEMAVDELLRRDMNPIVVMVASESFGGEGGSLDVAAHIQARGVPLKILRCENNILRDLQLNHNV